MRNYCGKRRFSDDVFLPHKVLYKFYYHLKICVKRYSFSWKQKQFHEHVILIVLDLIGRAKYPGLMKSMTGVTSLIARPQFICTSTCNGRCSQQIDWRVTMHHSTVNNLIPVGTTRKIFKSLLICAWSYLILFKNYLQGFFRYRSKFNIVWTILRKKFNVLNINIFVVSNN